MAAGMGCSGSPPLRVGVGSVDLCRREARGPSGQAPLTPLECSILEALALAAGAPLPSAVIRDAVFGAADGSDPRIVDVLICRLRKKLYGLGAGAPIATAWGLGYVLEGGFQTP